MTTNDRSISPTLVLSSLLLALPGTAVWAQDAPSTPVADTIERVTISTQKREQDSKDVPLSVTAFGTRFMQENHISDFSSLAQFTPGFVSAPNYDFVAFSSIRGISSTEFGFATDPSIAIYVDGVHQGLSGSQANAFFDMARVEVVKGPQATLFGRSSIAGAINAITQKPKPGFSASATVEAGNFGLVGADAFVNVELRDGLMLRVAAKTEHDGGFVRNLNGGGSLGGVAVDAARASLRWLATDDVQLDLKIGTESRQHGSNLFQSGLLAGRGYTVDISNVGSNNRSISHIKDAVAELKVDLRPGLTLTTNVSQRNVNTSYQEVFDAIPQVFSGPWQQGHDDRLSQQELRLAYLGDGGLSLMGGISHSKLTRSAFIAEYVDSTVLDSFVEPYPSYNIATMPTNLSHALVERGDYRGNYSDASVYADASVPLGAGFTLTGGARYASNQKTFSNSAPSQVFFLWPYYTSEPIVDSKKWSKTSYRSAVNFEMSRENTLYAAYTQGWKAGGFQTLTVSGPACYCDAYAAGARLVEVKPEIANNYEIGLKGNTVNRRLSYGLTAFHYDYSGLQKTVQTGLVYTVANVDAKGQGLEGEFGWRPDQHWNIYGNIGYTDTQVKNDPSDPRQNGLALNMAPRYTGVLGLTYSTTPLSALGGGSLYGGGNASFRSDYRNNDQLTNAVPGYGLLNLRAGWKSANGRYSLSTSVQNVFDRFTFGAYSPASNTFVSPYESRSVLGSPRRIGLELTASM